MKRRVPTLGIFHSLENPCNVASRRSCNKVEEASSFFTGRVRPSHKSLSATSVARRPEAERPTQRFPCRCIFHRRVGVSCRPLKRVTASLLILLSIGLCYSERFTRRNSMTREDEGVRRGSEGVRRRATGAKAAAEIDSEAI